MATNANAIAAMTCAGHFRVLPHSDNFRAGQQFSKVPLSGLAHCNKRTFYSISLSVLTTKGTVHIESYRVNYIRAFILDQGDIVKKFIAFLYGLVAYFVFFGSFLYAIGFVTGIVVPKTLDSGPFAPISEALVIDLLLLGLFAIQHSVMARQKFKQWWTQFVPAAVERSTYVLFASLLLILLFWQWRAIPATVWQVTNQSLAQALLGLSLVGWLIVLLGTFLINHFELFGLHQITNNLTGRTMPAPRFRTPFFYKVVRHPIYVGFLIAFWATPIMTIGHLLFCVMTTGYIVIGTLLEERDLVEMFGDDYRRYRERVSMLIPFWTKSS